MHPFFSQETTCPAMNAACVFREPIDLKLLNMTDCSSSGTLERHFRGQMQVVAFSTFLATTMPWVLTYFSPL